MYTHVIYRRHHKRITPLSSGPQCTINAGDWQLSCSSMFPRRPQLSAASCLLLRGICTHSVPERLGIPLQINGKKRLEERSRGGWKEPKVEKMKEKWDWNTAQLRRSPGKTKEAPPGVFGTFSPCCLSPVDCSVSMLRIFFLFLFFILFFCQGSQGDSKKKAALLTMPLKQRGTCGFTFKGGASRADLRHFPFLPHPVSFFFHHYQTLVPLSLAQSLEAI